MSSQYSSTAKTTAEWAEEYDQKQAEVARLEILLIKARMEVEFTRRAWWQSKWADLKAETGVSDIGDVPEMKSLDKTEEEDDRMRKRRSTERVSGPGICEACAVEERNQSKKATGYRHTREVGCRLNGMPYTQGRRPKRLNEPPSVVSAPAKRETEPDEIGLISVHESSSMDSARASV